MNSQVCPYTHDKKKLGVKPLFKTEGDLRHEHALEILLLGLAQCWAVLEALLLVLNKLGQHCAKTRAQNLPTHDSEKPN